MERRRSPYQKTLFLCTKSTCKKRGAKELRKALKQAIKDRGVSKKRLRIQACGCFDLCKHGPNAVLAHGGTWYADLKPKDAEALLDELLEKDPSEKHAAAK